MSTKQARHRWPLAWLVVFIAVCLVLLVPGGRGVPSARAATVGLQNPGFEDGSLSPWAAQAPVPDAAVVVGTEGPAQFATYGKFTPPITVTPKIGTKMLRLGTPKDISQSQPKGMNVVSQTFTSSSSTLKFAFWLFSWESRGNDNFGFNLTNAAGTPVGTLTPFTFTKNNVTMGCGALLPCNITPNTGGAKGAFLNSGWQIVTLTNVPVGQQLTLTYKVGGTTNNSFASWAYFDNVNLPPMAKFSMNFAQVDRGDITGQPTGERVGPLEGAPIQFVDQSDDPDGKADIVAWEWNITGPNLPIAGITLKTQNPFFIPSDNGAYTVTLKVTDSVGEWNSVTSGGTATDGTLIPAVNPFNAPPLVNALNVEALAGTTVNLAGRFSDAGWKDSHTATWTATGLSCGVATVQEDNVAALGTGKVDGTCAAAGAGQYAGTLTVTDKDGASRSDSFTITVRAAVPAYELADDNIATAPVRTTDGSYLSAIGTASDKDFFEVNWPGVGTNGPQLLPAGTEVVASLKNLPADYDLVLVAVPPSSTSTAGYAFSGYAFSGYAFSGYAFSELPTLVNPNTAGYAFSAMQRSAYAESGYAFSGYAFSGYAFSGYAFSGYAFSANSATGYAFSPFDVNGYAFSPISQFGFNGLNRSDISATDIRLAELALGGLPQGAKVVGFSANRGQNPEAVFARIDVPGTKLYAVVVGANGSFSTQPYTLELEASMPLSVAAFNSTAGGTLLGATNVCNTDRVFPNPMDYTKTVTVGLNGNPTNPKTLFVTQQERMQALYGNSEWSGALSSLTSLANATEVAGKIVSLPSNIYQNWDTNPCDIDAANTTAAAIKAVIQAELTANPTIEYVVTVGDDDIVPFRRVPDETVISNERYYLINSFLQPGSPLFASVQGGFNLSDDYYVDFVPTPWQGRELYVPDLAIGRLVETPAEIKAQADAFLGSGGQLQSLPASTAVVSGYDFFGDGATAIGLRIGMSFRNLINDTWSADQLRCQWLGVGTGCTQTPADVAAPNAHFTHYAGLSAKGFADLQANPNAPADVITSTDVKTAGGGSALLRRIVFTIGCHAGFSAPDGSTIAADATLGIDPKLDFAQAMARQRAVYIASTGFGLGDDQGLGGTEQLLVLFSEELFKSGATSGQALLAAKQRYLGGLPAMSVYDEKSSIQTVLYGLPMYRVYKTAPLLAAATAAGPDSGPFPLISVFGSPVVTADGQYFTAPGGDAAAPAYRPLEPRRVFENLTTTGQDPVHGVLLQGGSTFNDTPGFDPVIVRPTMEWEATTAEPRTCLTSFWPSELARVNTLLTPGGLRQTLVVTPGQFQCDSALTAAEGGSVRGTQRLFPYLNLEILRSPSQDTLAPMITTVDFQRVDAATLRVSVGAVDPPGTNPSGGWPGGTQSGVSRVVVLRVGAGTITTAGDQTFTPAPSGTFAVDVADPGSDTLIFEVVDAAGNVTTATAKGAGLRFISVDAGPDQLFSDGVPTTFPVTLLGTVAYPLNYFMDFGDGTTTSGTLTGGTLFPVVHQYVGNDLQLQYTARIRVTDTNGGVGADDVIVRRCYDPEDVSYSGSSQDPRPADYVGCAVSNDATTMTITLKTLLLGDPTSNDYSYRIYVNLAGSLTVYQMKYRNGQVTGPTGLVVTPSGNQITFRFPLSSIGWTTGQAIEWYAETRGGIKGTPETGSIDTMPDAGVFTSVPSP